MKREIKSSLKGRMALTLTVTFLIFTFVLLLVIRFVSTQGIKSFVLNHIHARQGEMDEGMVMALDEVNLLYSRMVLNEDFGLILQDEFLSGTEKEGIFQDLMDRVGVNTELLGDVLVHYQDQIYRLNGEKFYDQLPSLPFMEEVLRSTDLMEQGPMVQDWDGNWYLAVGKRMVNFPTGDITGSVIFLLNEEVLRTFTHSISSGLGYSMILTSEGTVITHTQGKYIGDRIITNLQNNEVRTVDGEKVLIIKKPAQSLQRRYNLQWEIVSVIWYDVLLEDVLRLNRYNLLFGVGMAFLAAVLSLTISSRITGPIERLTGRLRKFSKTGAKEPAPQAAVEDELWELEKTYDEMVERITDLMEKNREKLETQRKLELYALQMQINPHFLYNTLDAIAWMAKLEDQPEIGQLVMALAKFFRISLHKGDKYITVAEEIELVENFIAIELIRFPDKFTVEYEVAPDVEDELMLKLILQPIVENAVKHGIAGLDETGHIAIKAYGDDTFIWLEVIDDGLGFDPPPDLFSDERLFSDKRGGYGLKNVDERIKLEYGPECGLTVFSKPGGGTRVVVKIKRSSQPSSFVGG